MCPVSDVGLGDFVKQKMPLFAPSCLRSNITGIRREGIRREGPSKKEYLTLYLSCLAFVM